MTAKLTFNVSRQRNNLAIFFSSTMEFIDRVDDEIKTFLNDVGLTEYLFAVRVVMREGLTNSVRHAHHYNPDMYIKFALTINETTLTMIIEDQGEGFDWKAYRKNSCNDPGVSPPRDHGRGFPIMEDYFDEYWYNEKGNILTLKKNISS